MYYGEETETNRLIYTPSSFAKSSLLYLQEIGELKALKPHTSQRDHLSSYLFFHVSSGEGELHYCHKVFSLNSGDCVFIDCQKPYSHTTVNNLWSLKWIHFNGSMMSNIYEKYLERGGNPVFRPDLDFNIIWSSIYTTASSQDYIRDMTINEELSKLLSMLMRESWHPENHNHHIKGLDGFRSHLDQHYAEKLNLDELSEQFHINKYTLIRKFKQEYGLSIFTYLLTLRINHAKNELRFSQKSIEKIGLESGFGEIYYFSRVFKKTEGISPSDYRKMW